MNRSHCPNLGSHVGAFPARHRPAETGGARGAAAARAVCPAGAGLGAAVFRSLPDGPRVCLLRQRRQVHPGSERRGTRDDPSDSEGNETETLRVLPAAAADARQALPDLQALCPAVRPPLPLDRELRGGEKPSLVHHLPGGPAHRIDLGIPPGLVGVLLRPYLESLAAAERLPAGCLLSGGRVLRGGHPAARLPPLPGVLQHHHLGVHVPSPHLLPEALRGRREPLRPGHRPQPVEFLLPVPHRRLGEGLLPRGQRSHLTSFLSAKNKTWEVGIPPALFQALKLYWFGCHLTHLV